MVEVVDVHITPYMDTVSIFTASFLYEVPKKLTKHNVRIGTTARTATTVIIRVRMISIEEWGPLEN